MIFLIWSQLNNRKHHMLRTNKYLMIINTCIYVLCKILMSLEVIKLSSVENNLLIILKEVQLFSWRQITLSVLSSRTFLSRSLISSSSFVLCLIWSWHSSSSCCLSEFAAVMRSITSRRLWDSDYKKEKCFVSVEWLTIFCKRNNTKWQLVKEEVN